MQPGGRNEPPPFPLTPPVYQLHLSALALQERAEFLFPEEEAETVKLSDLSALKGSSKDTGLDTTTGLSV